MTGLMSPGNNDLLDPVCNLKDFTFSAFLKQEEIVHFMYTLDSIPSMPTMRYLYLFLLCEKVQAITGNDSFCQFVHDVGKFGDREPSLKDLYYTLHNLDLQQKTTLCLFLEHMTRGQSENALWCILRNGVISSSRLAVTIKKGSCPVLFDSAGIEQAPYAAGPVAFGLRCEETVKDVLSVLITTGQNKPRKHFGFMMSPNDGIYGVSLDFCTNTIEDQDENVHFTTNSCIYEIKSRFKYLFSKNEYDPIYSTYMSLYNSPSKKTFISFINSINRPAVEFVPDGRLPSENDYLLTRDKAWNLKLSRKRKITPIHQDMEACIKNNHWAESVLYILTDPSKSDGCIGIKDRLVLDIFINPRHPYFYQVLLQYKIVNDYIHWGKFAKPGNYPPRTNIVSAFFRRRSATDPLDCKIGSEVPLDNACEIPVAVLVTPVSIPQPFLYSILVRCTDIWKEATADFFENPPWVSSSLFASDGPK